MSHATTAQQQDPAPATVIVDQARLEEISRQADERSRQTLEASTELRRGGDPRAAEEAFHQHLGATFDTYVAELARHLPAFAPTIFAVWAHVLEQDRHGFADELCCRVPETLSSDPT